MYDINRHTDFSVGSGGTLGTLCEGTPFSRPCIYPIKYAGAPFLLALALGTGSHISPEALQFVQTTGGESLDLYQSVLAKQHRVAVASAKDQVSTLKAELGLSISDIANVLKVRRPTIYQWLAGSEPRRSNIQRLHGLHKVALEWRDLSSEKPGVYIRTPILEGRSLMDILCDDEIDFDQVTLLLHRINERLSSDVAVKSQRSIAARLAQKGYDQPTKEEQAENLRGYSTLVSEGRN